MNPILTSTGPSPNSLRPQELAAVYAISKAVAQAADIEQALDEIARLARPVLIFDNLMLYSYRQEELEPVYARVIGRGRSAEAELSWGELMANEVVAVNGALIQIERLNSWETDRLSLRYFLGLPLRSGDNLLGAVVLGRFGGPSYSTDQIYLAEFVADFVGQLLVRERLINRIANLEADKRLQELQENFIATISHELRTPLGFIKGYATTLLRQDISWDEDARREFLTVIDDEADRLRGLIDDLLDSSRLQTGTLNMQMQQIRLDILLQEVVLRARTLYNQIQMTLDALPVTIQADPVRLTQVLDNLISNAVKYAPGSSIEIVLGKSGDRCQLMVRDYGPGIAPQHVGRLFERFYRVPDNTTKVHGTGLGLYICQEIVLAHQGVINVESTFGEGTTFCVDLPVIQVENVVSQANIQESKA